VYSQTSHSLIKQHERVCRIIWLAFLAAVPAYVCAVYLVDLLHPQTEIPPEAIKLFSKCLVVVSIVAAILAPIVPRWLVSDSRMRQLIDEPPEALARDAKIGWVSEDLLSKIKTLSPDEKRLYALLAASFAPFMIRLAFNESIALFGLVLALFSRSVLVILPFAVVSFALNLMVPPPVDSARTRLRSLSISPADPPLLPR
jgi:hypothetical protein